MATSSREWPVIWALLREMSSPLVAHRRYWCRDRSSSSRSSWSEWADSDATSSWGVFSLAKDYSVGKRWSVQRRNRSRLCRTSAPLARISLWQFPYSIFSTILKGSCVIIFPAFTLYTKILAHSIRWRDFFIYSGAARISVRGGGILGGRPRQKIFQNLQKNFLRKLDYMHNVSFF